MGNFRGVFPRKMTGWRQAQGNYWNYNIDHLGIYDVDSFIKKIVAVKTYELMELGLDPKNIQLKITYVGHSMGGMTLPIYLISKARKQEPHHLH
jgi:hypothetical protein